MFRKIVGGVALTAALSATGAQAAQAQALQMPFECKQTVSGKVYSGHSPANAIDFNGLGGGDTDLGMRVVAAGSGVVKVSTYYTSNGYGNAIEIDHGGGKSSFYAHLRDRGVGVGSRVKRGQLIGHLGKTSAKYTFTAHLHYEQRQNGGVVQASFNGRLSPTYANFGNATTMKSANCGGSAPPQPSPSGGSRKGVKLPAIRSRFAAQIQTDNGLRVIGRRGVRSSAKALRRFASGSGVKIVCQKRGQRVTGKFGTSRIWDLIDIGGGRGVYVTDTYVYTGSDGRVAPSC